MLVSRAAHSSREQQPASVAWLPRAVPAVSPVSVASPPAPPVLPCVPWLLPVACCVRRRCPAAALALPVAVVSVALACVLAWLPSDLLVPVARARVAVPVLLAVVALVPRVVAAWWVPAVSPVLPAVVPLAAVALVLPVVVVLALLVVAVPLVVVVLVSLVAALLVAVAPPVSLDVRAARVLLVAARVSPVAAALVPVVVACWAGVLLPVVARRRRRRSVVITMWCALTASRSSRRAWLAVPLAAPIS